MPEWLVFFIRKAFSVVESMQEIASFSNSEFFVSNSEAQLRLSVKTFQIKNSAVLSCFAAIVQMAQVNVEKCARQLNDFPSIMK